jgi:hypothetical protein
VKITIDMRSPEEKKHSTKFSGFAAESYEGLNQPVADEIARKAQFYLPKPLAVGKKRIRVTIEEVE